MSDRKHVKVSWDVYRTFLQAIYFKVKVNLKYLEQARTTYNSSDLTQENTFQSNPALAQNQIKNHLKAV